MEVLALRVHARPALDALLAEEERLAEPAHQVVGVLERVLGGVVLRPEIGVALHDVDLRQGERLRGRASSS